MARQKKILLDNAWVSWANAIRYCDLIIAGRVTLEVRKNFVATLQNAVELFLKQIMLDKADHRVAEPRKVAPDGEPARSYYESQNLNHYFEVMDDSQIKKFFSIDFCELMNIHKKLLGDFLMENSIAEELKLIQKLRNNETHFYIQPDEYLTENEFLKLYNFMVYFNGILHEFELLPFYGYPGKEHQKLCFERDYLHSFSYRDAVRSAPMVSRIAEIAKGAKFDDFFPITDYEIAEFVASNIPDISDQEFDSIWAYIEIMNRFHMIDFVQLEEKVIQQEDGYCCYHEDGEIVHLTFEFTVDLS